MELAIELDTEAADHMDACDEDAVEASEGS
jgi:hypothetical protein